MIPARLGSTRVKNKNLRLINNKPLISYVIETVKKTNIFDDIYLNSDSYIFDIYQTFLFPISSSNTLSISDLFFNLSSRR